MSTLPTLLGLLILRIILPGDQPARKPDPLLDDAWSAGAFAGGAPRTDGPRRSSSRAAGIPALGDGLRRAFCTFENGEVCGFNGEEVLEAANSGDPFPGAIGSCLDVLRLSDP